MEQLQKCVKLSIKNFPKKWQISQMYTKKTPPPPPPKSKNGLIKQTNGNIRVFIICCGPARGFYFVG